MALLTAPANSRHCFQLRDINGNLMCGESQSIFQEMCCWVWARLEGKQRSDAMSITVDLQQRRPTGLSGAEVLQRCTQVLVYAQGW